MKFDKKKAAAAVVAHKPESTNGAAAGISKKKKKNKKDKIKLEPKIAAAVAAPESATPIQDEDKVQRNKVISQQIEKQLENKKIKKTKLTREKKKAKRLFNAIPKTRGVVLVRHIPHGFYEEQLKAFFSQFGQVTRARVSRNLKTGNSKGFAFVEFQVPEVAKIAAEAMHNYIMFKKRLETKFIPPEEQKFNYFATSLHKIVVDGEEQITSAAIKRTQKSVSVYNSSVPKLAFEKRISRVEHHLGKLKEKMKEIGIDVDPVIIRSLVRSPEEEAVAKSVKEENKATAKPKKESPKTEEIATKPAKKETSASPKQTVSELVALLNEIGSDEEDDDDFEVDLDKSGLEDDDDDSIDEEEEDEEDDMGDDDDDSVTASDDDGDDDDESEDDDDDEDDDDSDESEAVAPTSPPKRKASTVDPNFKNLLARQNNGGIQKAKHNQNQRPSAVPNEKMLKQLKGLINKNQPQQKQVVKTVKVNQIGKKKKA